MRKIHTLTAAAILTLSSLMLVSCGKSEFNVISDTDKRIVISAENAAEDDAVSTGALVVDDGEEVVITSDLTKGTIRVEIVEAPGDGSDDLPETGGEAIMTANVQKTDSATAEFAAGSYLVKATCLEEATGTVVVEAKAS